MSEDGARAALREIADGLKEAAGPGVGFAAFLAPLNKPLSYLSNANRDDVIKTLEEWLQRTQGAGFGSSSARWHVPANDTGETSEAREKRLALENRCAKVGKMLAQFGGVLIFFFDFGEGGNLAYFTSLKDARQGVRSWIDSQRKV